MPAHRRAACDRWPRHELAAVARLQHRLLYCDRAARRAGLAAAADAAALEHAVRPVLVGMRAGLLKAIVGLDGEIRGLDKIPPGALPDRDEASIGLGHADPAGRAARSRHRPEARIAMGAVLRLVCRACRLDRDRPRRRRGGAAPHGGVGAAGGGGRPRDRDLPRGHPDGARPAPRIPARDRGAVPGARSAAGAGGGQFRAVLGPPQLRQAAGTDHPRLSRPDPAGIAAPPADARTRGPHRKRHRGAGTRSRRDLSRGGEPVLLAAAEDLVKRIGYSGSHQAGCHLRTGED